MGSGGGGSAGPYKIGGISGQGGGRILPGGPSGVGEVLSANPRVDAGAEVAAGYPDNRPNPPYGTRFDTAFASPGGGPGLAGQSDSFVLYYFMTTVAGSGTTLVPVPVTTRSGGGGGWGAAGGNGTFFETTTSTLGGANIGGAGGKAINTNGHALTWLGGSTRAYGAIG